MNNIKKIAILGGGRIPFQPSGTIYKDLSNIDLLKLAFEGVFKQTNISKEHINCVYAGNVIQEVTTSNVAREAALSIGLNKKIPATTIAQACISSGQCISIGMDKIRNNESELILAGGVETFSDVPIRFPKKMRKWLIDLPKIKKKGNLELLKYITKIKPSYLIPEPPKLSNYTTGELMGYTSETISERFNISRNDQDEFTIRSHRLANDAHIKNLYSNEIFEYKNSTNELNIKGDIDKKKISKLKPSFKKNGTHTAANSTGLSDGATSCIISSESKAKELQKNPLGYILDCVFVGTDPYKEMLLGPAYAIPKLLERNNLTLNDIDVFEIHEAFAGQILSNINALNDEIFCRDNFNSNKLGEIPIDKLNLWGGSISIGHPLAASNIRNIMTAVHRLKKEDKELALVAACADSGLATAFLIQRN